MNNKINSITFKVNENVNKNSISFKEFDIKYIISDTNEINNKSNIINGNNNNSKRILSTSIKDIESKYIGYNSFVMSAIEAYSNHHHLVIRPDDIYMAILNQFSIYLEKNSLELKHKFIETTTTITATKTTTTKTIKENEEKKILTVYTPYSVINGDAPYDQLTIDMTKEIEKNIKDPSIRDWLIPQFSTTTDIDKVVYSASLMSCTKSYFQFEYQTLCGLPEVTLLGSIDDWINLKERIQRLKEFNLNNIKSPSKSIISKIFSKKNQKKDNQSNQMNKWVEMLNPVIDKIIESVKGNPDIKFWDKIASKKRQSGSNDINGWITIFCVFDCNSNWYGDNKETKYHFDEIQDNDDIEKEYKWLDIPISTIPRGYLNVPILLKDINGLKINSILYTGHMCIKIKENSTLIPQLDWLLLIDN